MDRKLRIAVWYNLPSGGAKRALYHQVRGLVERGHTVEAWRPPLKHETFASLDDVIEEHEVPLEIMPEGSNYVQKIVRHVLRPRRLMSAMKAHSATCARQIDAGEFDLLFANTDMYFAMPFIGRYSHLPKCVYLQEPRRPYYESLPELPWIALPESVRRSWSLSCIKKRTRNRFDLALVRNEAREELENARAYDKILVNSLFSRESVMRAYGVNADVCYLGIDTGQFRDLGLPRERFLIGLGTIGPTKNVKFAIEAVGALPEPRLPLIWVGNMTDDVYVPQMLELAKNFRVDFQPRVMVADEELLQLLNRAALMIYAPRLEPFGLAPLEANACGLPVVGVAEGGLRETIVDGINGRLTLPTAEALAQGIQELLDDTALLSRMRESAKAEVAAKWSLVSSVDRIEAALLQVADRA